MTDCLRDHARRRILAVIYGLCFFSPFVLESLAVDAWLPGAGRMVRDTIGLLPYVAVWIALVCVLPLVGYRRRDALSFLIPLYGLGFTFRVIWRLAALPHRDCPAPPEPGWTTARTR